VDSEINEIKVNGVDYVRKDSCPEKKYEGDVKIVILQRGWVYVGRYNVNMETSMCELNSAYCIRVWGTTKGLSELKDGPTSTTKLDPAGRVVFHLLTTIAIIDCAGDAWKKHCK
jgi:hypothetical protein